MSKGFIKIFKNKNYKLALILGTGSLPNLVLKEIVNLKVKSYAFCPIGFNVDIPKNIDKVFFDLNDLNALILALNKNNVTHLAFAGKIDRNDFKNKSFIFENKKNNKTININLNDTDDKLLRTIGAFFENHGFNIISIQELVPDSLLKAGVLTKIKPSNQDKLDIKKAIDLHNIMSNADMGQSVIVSHGLCIAAETLPGTDSMIKFVYNFKKSKNIIKHPSSGVFFKSLKKNQDPRFDFPVIGEKTLIEIKKSKLNGLALKENKLILLNKEKLIKVADSFGLFICTVK